MLSNDSLGDRLNALKQGKPLPPPPAQQSFLPPHQQQQLQQNLPNQPNIDLKTRVLSKSFLIFDSLLASFLYGIALKAIFVTDWNLFSSFAVGFLLNHAISIFPRILFPKLFK